MSENRVVLFPRIVDCFPDLKSLPGCSVPTELTYSSSLSYSAPSSRCSTPGIVETMEQNSILLPSPSDDDDIAIPSGMPPSTKRNDLPSIPPPAQYWKLKKLDPSANVMDYWIKASHEWDLEGIESDVSVCLREIQM
jgi:hypothetical protein